MFKVPFRRRSYAVSPEAAARNLERSRRRAIWRHGSGLATLVALVVFTVWAIPRLDRIASVSHVAKAVIADGDTLTLGAERIRLKGIDAPEFSQTCKLGGRDYACGREARNELIRLVGNQAVSCAGWERDKYGRLLALCTAGDRALNAALVENGWAVAYGDYAAEEVAARAAGRGLWAGEFERPSTWRAAHGDMADSEHTTIASILNALKSLLGLN